MGQKLDLHDINDKDHETTNILSMDQICRYHDMFI